MPNPGKAPAEVPVGNGNVPADTLPDLDVTPGIPLIPVEKFAGNLPEQAEDALDEHVEFFDLA